jgi:hypothetical protein
MKYIDSDVIDLTVAYSGQYIQPGVVRGLASPTLVALVQKTDICKRRCKPLPENFKPSHP